MYYLNSTNCKKFNKSVHKLFVDNNKFSKVEMFLDYRIYNLDIENMHEHMQLLLTKIWLILLNVI